MNARIVYYYLAFVEGMLVMGLELISARLLSPYFGNSLYVITSVLGITMLGLLCGYYFGGRIVNSGFKPLTPFYIVLGASCWLILITPISQLFLNNTLAFGLIGGVLLATILILGIPLTLLGATSPLLVQSLNNIGFKAGVASGNIYSISTLGGVVSTFVTGLILIPNSGIKVTSLIIGVFVGMSAIMLALYSNSRHQIYTILAVSTLVLASFGSYAMYDINLLKSSTCHYQKDGLLGSISVCDYGNIRVLSNNGTDQSKIRISDGVSIMLYSHVVASACSLLPKSNRNNALLVGLAGGSLINELNDLGFQEITAIDIDKRTHYVATNFFGVAKESYNFIEDDGRHYLLTTEASYDLIIIDVSVSEEQPYHLYTREAISLYKEHLHPGGLIVFNLIDDIGPDKGKIVDKVADGLSYNNLSPRLLKEFYPIQYMDKSLLSTHIHERIVIGSNNGYYEINEDVYDLNPCCLAIDYNKALKQDFSAMTYEQEELKSHGFRDDIPEMETINFDRIKKLRNSTFITQ